MHESAGIRRYGGPTRQFDWQNPPGRVVFSIMSPQQPLFLRVRHIPGMALGCLLAAGFPAMADEVSLMDGGRLSGSVVTIRDGGSLELTTLLADGPLAVKGDQVKRVKFDTRAPAGSPGDARVELVNGDFLTASVLGYTAESGARIRVDGIGELAMPPAHLRSLSLGVRAAQVIYQGPDDLENWSSEGGRSDSNWDLNDGRFSIDGAGRLGRMLELPDQYVIRFTLSWQGQPNFQFSFADPLKEQFTRVDRYYLQFGRAGLEIKRETSAGRQYQTVGALNRQPEQFPNRSMDVEIRVDRRESMIYLAINGQPEGRFSDPFPNPPTANGIAMVSNASRGNQHEIHNLTVMHWNENPGPAATVERGDPKLDTLIMREGDQYSGNLQSIREVDGRLVFSLKVSFREQPLEMLGEDVAMVLFATGEGTKPATPAKQDFVLQLHDRGRLAVTSSTFEGQEARAVHPLLGELRLARDGISAMERRTQDEKTPRK
jgi:hypothetical protein